MLPELTALLAAFLTALSRAMANRGIKDSNPDTANLILTGIQTIVLTGILTLDVPELNMMAIFWFSLAGVFESFIGRLLTMTSYKLLGVSSSSALIGTSPVMAAFSRGYLLKRTISLVRYSWCFSIIRGIYMLNSRSGHALLNYRNIYLPVGAAYFYAMSNIILKLGINLQPNSILSA